MFYLTQFWFCYWTEFACTKVGEQEDFINTVLTAILQTPQYVPQDLRYYILILVSINTPIWYTHIYIYILLLEWNVTQVWNFTKQNKWCDL